MIRYFLRLAILGGALMLGLGPTPALAYNVFSLDASHALKWGDNTVGTSGGVVTWSLMADGTGLDASAPTGLHGTSSLGGLLNMIDNAYGSGTAHTLMTQAFGYWSSVANIRFVEVTETGTVPFSAPSADVGANIIGDIRIGAYDIDGFSGAVGYAPPPNGGTTLEGDILFNFNVAYQVVDGTDGNSYGLYPFPSPTNSPAQDGWYHNDFLGLFVHELGHALGLAHTDVASAVMCGYVDSNFDGSACAYYDQPPFDGLAPINHQPDTDDIAGIQYLYGATPVPEPGTYFMFAAGLALLGSRLVRQHT